MILRDALLGKGTIVLQEPTSTGTQHSTDKCVYECTNPFATN